MCYTNLEDGNSPHFNVIVTNQHHFDLQILIRSPYLLKFCIALSMSQIVFKTLKNHISFKHCTLFFLSFLTLTEWPSRMQKR